MILLVKTGNTLKLTLVKNNLNEWFAFLIFSLSRVSFIEHIEAIIKQGI